MIEFNFSSKYLVLNSLDKKVQYMELIEEFEPRASVEEVSFIASGGAGNMIPKVVLTYNAE